MTHRHVPAARLADIPVAEIQRRLAAGGLTLRLGIACIRVHSRLADVAEPLRTVYGAHPWEADSGRMVDAVVRILPGNGLRRWLRPHAHVEIDGIDPFGPAVRAHWLPHFEWSINWAIASAFNAHLLLHAGAVVHRGHGVLLAASPGSGKSTLTAAMAARGSRLLSDEFGVVRTDDLGLMAVAKPVALKNDSIGLIRDLWPDARMGPVFPKTRKGDLAHLAVPAASVDAIDAPAMPDIVLFPKWSALAQPCAVPVAPASAFMELATHSFNYEIMGPVGFETVGRLIDRCSCWHLAYSTLEQAIDLIDRIIDESAPRAFECAAGATDRAAGAA